jgi:transcriptional regulator with GAF, ATPase, and Fis domain
VRELENVIERAAILSQGSRLQIDETLLRSSPITEPTISGTLEEVERTHMIRVLQEVEWVIEGNGGAARRLGLHPNTLRSRMQKLGIKKPRPTA